MVQIALRVPTEVKEALKAAAQADDRTLSSLLMRIIKEWSQLRRDAQDV